MKVGSEVEYNTGDRRKSGEVLGVYSDNFDEVKVDNDNLVYWSKKTKSWRPVKEKDMGSIFFEIKGKGKDPIDYVLVEELVFSNG